MVAPNRMTAFVAAMTWVPTGLDMVASQGERVLSSRCHIEQYRFCSKGVSAGYQWR